MLTLLHGHQKVKKERFVATFKVETRKLDTNPTNPTMPNQPNHAQPTQPTEHPTTFRPQEATVQPGCKVAGSFHPRLFVGTRFEKTTRFFSQKTRLPYAMRGQDVPLISIYICLCKFDPLIFMNMEACPQRLNAREIMCFQTILFFFKRPSTVCFRSFWSPKLGYSLQILQYW